MSLEKLSDRPLMGALDHEFEVVERPPVSPLAIVALALGSLSLFSTFGPAMLPAPIIAIAFGFLIYWKLNANPGMGGKNLALTGFALGILFLVWSVTATRLRNEYMYAAGGQFAKHFLTMMSAGKRYEAFELTRPEHERQIPGTSLEKYYSSNTSPEVKESLDAFIKGTKTSLIESRGKSAAWEMVRGAGVSLGSTGNVQVIIAMEDKSQQPHALVRVQLERDDKSISVAKAREPTATWMVRSVGD